MAEPLEGRSYLSMTIDLRVTGGAKTAAVTAVGQVVNLQAYAVISGTTAGTNDAFLDAVGSFLGTEAGANGVVGNLSAKLIPTFQGSAASSGTVQDLNGDGGLDVGSNSTTDVSGYFAARSGDVDYDGTVSGDTNTFLLATLTYTVTSLGNGTATALNFRPSGSVTNSYSAVWLQDGSPFYSATADANFQVGTAVTLTGPATTTPTPTPTPTPTATQLVGTTFGTAGSYGNSGNTIAKATDGNLTTFFDSPAASGSYVGIDLGSAQTVSQIKYAPRSGWASRMVGGTFQASNSSTFASGVVTVATIAATPTVGVLTTVTPNTTTAYRYWRYVGPANGYCDIAEFQLFGTATTTPTATQLTGTTFGTAGSYGNSGNTIAKATDGSVATFFDAPTASGSYVAIDLGSAKAVTRIAYAPRSGWAARMVGGTFQASSSSTFASGVVTVATITATPTVGVLTTVTPNTTTAYRYWRYVGPANGYCDIAEFQLFGTSTGTTLTQRTGTAIGTAGSYQNDGSTIARAVDGNLSTFFDGPTANGDWVGLDLGTATSVSAIEFAPRSGWSSRMVGGAFQASNTADFSSGVVTLATVSSAPVEGSLTTVTLTTAASYRYYRYLAPANSYGDIAEFELFG